MTLSTFCDTYYTSGYQVPIRDSCTCSTKIHSYGAYLVYRLWAQRFSCAFQILWERFSNVYGVYLVHMLTCTSYIVSDLLASP